MLDDLPRRVLLEFEQREALKKLSKARDRLNNIQAAMKIGITEPTDDPLLLCARAEVAALTQEQVEATRRLMDYLMQSPVVLKSERDEERISGPKLAR